MSMTRCCICVVFLVHILNITLVNGTGCPSPDLISPCRCLMKAEEYQVWCSHSDLPKVLHGLRSLSQLIQSPIDELILENNYLPSLPGRTFSTLKILRLMVRQNGLERVSHDWLFGLESILMELFIVEPKLRYLPDESLSRLNALEAITIQTNDLKRLPQVSELAKLRYLQIESRDLAELSSRNFKHLPLLEKFHMSRSRMLKRLEAGLFDELAALKSINISFCGINWLHPRTFFNLPMIEELSLVGNMIEDVGMVGRASKDLISLKTIHLDFNKMNTLSEGSFVDIPSLQSLHLSHNNIIEIHYGAFHRVPNLRTLNLNNNLLRRVHPQTFLQPSDSRLEEVWMVHNHISHISELKSLLDALPRLIFLEMSYNNLEIISFGSLRGHPTLEVLKINHNKLYQIDKESFMAMPALRELGLKNNSLTNFNQEPLWNLPSLKGLDISHNYYKRLEPLFLMNLPSLRRLDLNHNQLVTIDPIVFSTTPLIEFVNISNNDLQFIHPATFKHLSNLYEIDFSHNQIHEFSVELPKELEHLHLKFNKLRMLPIITETKEYFSLKYLDLSNNLIEKIHPYNFRSYPSLKKLYIRKNLIRRLEEGTFDNLSKLEILDLNGNKITHLHPDALKNVQNLIEVNLRDNNIETILPTFLHKIPKLTKFNLSKNKLVDFVPGTLNYNPHIKYLNLSHNFLVKVPQNIFKMKHMRILDLSHNRIKFLPTGIFSKLEELVDLRLSKNYIKELKVGTFNSLQKIRILHLDHNDIDGIETNSFQSLPSLEIIKLDSNSLSRLPRYTFNSLALLQIIELQNNLLEIVSNNAFNLVPSLLVLNLSNNHIMNVEDAGLRSSPSLEVLDLSNNLIEKIDSNSFRKMDWLVEVRIDGNNICGMFGTPFSSMPRLRVISLKKNKLTRVSENILDKIRTNLATFNIDDNPLDCNCKAAWLHTWAEESSTKGPRCSDGSLLREKSFSSSDCGPDEIDDFSTQCGIQNSQHLTSQIFSKFTNSRNISSSERTNNIPPLPQESEYFYDEYVDYPFNDSLTTMMYEEGNILDRFVRVNHSSLLVPKQSSHVTSGDTPTLYAATSSNKTKPDIPKEVPHSPSSSGFTFFGVPLPSLNFNQLLSGNKKSSVKKIEKPELVIPVAERKVAIMNTAPIPRATLQNGVFRSPPSFPVLETGGFVPMLPGDGKFQPIFNPTTIQTQRTNENFHTEPSVPRTTSIAMSLPPKKILQTTGTDLKNSASSDSVKNNSVSNIPQTTTPKYSLSTILSTMQTIKTTTISKIENKHKQNESTVVSKNKTDSMFHSDTNVKTRRNSYVGVVEVKDVNKEEKNLTKQIERELFTNLQAMNQSTSIASSEILSTQVNHITVSSTGVTEVTTNKPENNFLTLNKIANLNNASKKIDVASSLSTLLVPGGQQPYVRPAGRPKITKVQSPYTTEVILPSLREHNLKKIRDSVDTLISEPAITDQNDDNESWYFANYNKTSSEPFHGRIFSNGVKINTTGFHVLIFIFLLGI